MSDWDKFKKKESRVEGRSIGGCYRCQFCPEIVLEATYFPMDQVLKYRCTQDHVSFIENFKVSF